MRLAISILICVCAGCGPVDSGPDSGPDADGIPDACARIDTSQPCIERHSPDWCFLHSGCWRESTGEAPASVEVRCRPATSPLCFGTQECNVNDDSFPPCPSGQVCWMGCDDGSGCLRGACVAVSPGGVRP